MKINIGSKNQVKIDAVMDAVKLYPNLFKDPEFLGLDAGADLYGHPKNLEETIRGAVQRAENAFKHCEYSFGLEGGLMEVPFTKSGFMEVSACAIYDGKDFCLGLSPAFEWPKEVTKLIVGDKADASKAFKQLGYTEYEKLGAVKGGIIGFLTKDRLAREDLIKYSIIMALIHLENKNLY